MSLIKDSDLEAILTHADVEDLCILIDHVTDQGKGRISLSASTCRTLVKAKSMNQVDEVAIALIAEEVSRFGGNSVMNVLRGGSGVPYREALRDVASHIGASYSSKSESSQIEFAVLLHVLEQSLEKMTEEERRKLFEEFGAMYVPGKGPATIGALITAVRLSGFGAYKLAAVVANAVAKAILGRGLTFGASATLMRGISIFTGPIGWAITAIWTAFDLASPAYRVTVPCIIQIAYMRQKAMAAFCPHCSTTLPTGAKFCNECGKPIAPVAPLLTTDLK